MTVKIVAVTQPVGNECATAEELIAYCARVSAPANQADHSTSAGLIKYLIENDHWSPLEMANVVVEIKTTRDIGRQIIRHRSFSFQEFSQRYAKVIEGPVLREARLQDKTNRQNSIELPDSGKEVQVAFDKSQELVWDMAKRAYDTALEIGIAKEQARALLPEGMTPTTMYMNGTLRSWLHYLLLRCGNGTQKEHVLVANEIREALREHFPEIMAIVEELTDATSNNS